MNFRIPPKVMQYADGKKNHQTIFQRHNRVKIELSTIITSSTTERQRRRRRNSTDLASSERALKAAVSWKRVPLLWKYLSYFSQPGVGKMRRKLPMWLFSWRSSCSRYCCWATSSSSLAMQWVLKLYSIYTHFCNIGIMSMQCSSDIVILFFIFIFLLWFFFTLGKSGHFPHGKPAETVALPNLN